MLRVDGDDVVGAIRTASGIVRVGDPHLPWIGLVTPRIGADGMRRGAEIVFGHRQDGVVTLHEAVAAFSEGLHRVMRLPGQEFADEIADHRGAGLIAVFDADLVFGDGVIGNGVQRLGKE